MVLLKVLIRIVLTNLLRAQMRVMRASALMMVTIEKVVVVVVGLYS